MCRTPECTVLTTYVPRYRFWWGTYPVDTNYTYDEVKKKQKTANMTPLATHDRLGQSSHASMSHLGPSPLILSATLVSWLEVKVPEADKLIGLLPLLRDDSLPTLLTLTLSSSRLLANHTHQRTLSASPIRTGCTLRKSGKETRKTQAVCAFCLQHLSARQAHLSFALL